MEGMAAMGSTCMGRVAEAGAEIQGLESSRWKEDQRTLEKSMDSWRKGRSDEALGDGNVGPTFFLREISVMLSELVLTL